jgi:hypothetical protein
MKDNDQYDAECLINCEISDEALEITAGTMQGQMATCVVFCTGLDTCPA